MVCLSKTVFFFCISALLLLFLPDILTSSEQLSISKDNHLFKILLVVFMKGNGKGNFGEGDREKCLSFRSLIVGPTLPICVSI